MALLQQLGMLGPKPKKKKKLSKKKKKLAALPSRTSNRLKGEEPLMDYAKPSPVQPIIRLSAERGVEPTTYRNVVDEDLTDLTNGELVAGVARDLAHQEAVDVRLRRAPDLNDTAWEKIHAGPSGELYDLGALSTVVSTLLKSYGQTGQKSIAPAWWWSRVHIGTGSDPQMARLRLFCRLRGIELPYREDHEPGVRAAGMADALQAAMSGGGRADVLVVISDLEGLRHRPAVVLKTLGLARRGGQQVVFVAPFGPAFARAATTATGARVATAMTAAERDRFERARGELQRHGIPVLECGPADTVAALARRIVGTRTSVRRVA
jgi:hypothetical protein